jgi:hypothetical protein
MNYGTQKEWERRVVQIEEFFGTSSLGGGCSTRERPTKLSLSADPESRATWFSSMQVTTTHP